MTKNEARFLDACRLGNVGVVKYLIESSLVNINIQDSVGHTGLNLAIFSKSNEVAEYLINYGINIELPDDHCRTALLISAEQQNSTVLSLLIKRGANVNHANRHDATALITSAHFDNSHDVELLLKNGANINHKNENGSTALILSINRHAYQAAQTLIDFGADISILNNNNYSAFKVASSNKDIRAMLIINKDLLYHKDNDGNTLLMKACQSKNEKDIIVLFEKGANFHEKNNKGDTPYKVLKRKRSLSSELQSLKEMLILNNELQDIDNDISVSL